MCMYTLIWNVIDNTPPSVLLTTLIVLEGLTEISPVLRKCPKNYTLRYLSSPNYISHHSDILKNRTSMGEGIEVKLMEELCACLEATKKLS